jgi:hypothetical protein
MLGATKMDIKINVQIDTKDTLTIINISGKLNLPDLIKYTPEGFEEHAIKILFAGTKKSASMLSWVVMDSLAQKYEGGTISYEIR